MARWPVMAMLFGWTSVGWAQVALDERPVTADDDLVLAAPEEVALPGVDQALLAQEDRLRDADKSLPWRFGVPFDVDLDAATTGTWTRLPDGRRLWRLGITAPGAFHQNLLFDTFVVPPGARLWIRGDGHTIGAFSDANHRPDDTLATTLVRGETVTLEYVEPADAPFPGRLHVKRVTHGYRDAFARAGRSGLDKALGSSGTCNQDVACGALAERPDQVRSVGMMVVGGSGFCSGALVNNVANDNRPFFLTANHCVVGDDPSGWVFWFNWQRTGCGTGFPEPPDTLSGASLVASRSDSDFALLELDDPVPDAYALYFAGLDHRGIAPASTFGIHHPRGDAKMYSEDADPPVDGTYSGTFGTHWRVRDWDLGTTEGGSSGSPLFDDTGRIIGQLHGGSAACGNDRSDYYGKVARSWSDGSSPATRLRDHLDPEGLTGGSIPGRDGRVSVDVGIEGIEWPTDDATVCAGGFQPRIRMRNGGRDELTSVRVEVSVDGGEPVVTDWTGSLSPGAVTTVLPDPVVVAAGPRLLTVRVASPNGGVDDLPLNDRVSVGFSGAASQTMPLAERFDDAWEPGAFPPDGWQLHRNGGAAFEPAFLGSRSFGAAVFDNFRNDESGRIPGDGLVTPPVDLTVATSAELSVEIASARGRVGPGDGLRVHVSGDCGATFDLAAEWDATDLVTDPNAPTNEVYAPGAGDYAEHTVDLAPWIGSDRVLVRLENVSSGGNALYVDNVRITDGLPVGPVVTPTPDDAPGGCSSTPGLVGVWGIVLGLGLIRTRR